ncbi:DDE-type integrase/transposase/recombinase [Mycobacteroides chelonae]|nr:DDE-type integrase/transposase/recombinase [Mycobacteroides chelonae]MBV6361077.1 DDE-type integrase/transposase/recombinase [Mycobacteroides chelonae]UJW64603.1 DDE-type integrase/transposase/recombinase [Mycobacteroides chelonae]UJW67981.1 DDE-type integrase/transposase/recombinase [Mycobacteroides chelonae]
MLRAAAVRVGDEICLSGEHFTVLSITDGAARLLSATGERTLVPLPRLCTDPSLELVSTSWPPLCSEEALAGVPPEAVERARWWERHLIEVITGRSASNTDTAPPGFDPSVTTLRKRELAKVAELNAEGCDVNFKTLQRQRRLYQRDGLLGVVDRRYLPQRPVHGRVDPRVAAAVTELIAAETDLSTGTVRRLRRKTAQALTALYGDGGPQMPSETTFYRLVWRLSAGKHTFGSARTRRSLAKQPEKPFGVLTVARPGEVVEIDSTKLDVSVRFDDGTVGRVELIGMVDCATRTIAAAVLRPTTTAIDAALLLARSLTPEPMRPGWSDAVRMTRSVLPHHSLSTLDHRFEAAAARPVIAPETIVIDHGKAYLSQTFSQACCTLGINLQPAHPDEPTDKPKIERTIESVGTMFASEVAGYVGSSVERRGKHAEKTAVWSIVQLQALLDEWIVTAWQNRPHDGLRDPVTPGKTLTPNEKYAALVGVAGYVPVALTGDDYIELLPARWRKINSYGVRINNRHYDAKALNPYRGQTSGVGRKNGRWEVHFDPCDVSRIWVRNHHDTGWIQAHWTHLRTSPVPFGETIWKQSQQIVSERGQRTPTEAEIATAAEELLARAAAGPPDAGGDKKTRRMVTRAHETTLTPLWPRPAPELATEDCDEDADSTDAVMNDPIDDGDVIDVATVVPLPVFDARKEARLWRL